MLSIKWNDKKMNLGINSIDEQHKRLFDLINNIIVSIESNNQIQDTQKIVENAIDYTKYHFLTEETLFEEYGLDITEINKHIEEHNIFINKVENIYEKLNRHRCKKYSDEIEILTELYDFLINWLINHVLIEDKKMFNNLG